ncbi:MAG: molybdenum cofactor guanylyltransferase [Arenimonas sp.]
MSAARSTLSRARVALGVLAGGQALRLGGLDKALARFRGQALVERTLDGLGNGFAQVLLSYNGADAGALPPSAQVIADLRPGFPGPLAGIEALLTATSTEWLLTVPVDLAELPQQLVQRLLESRGAEYGISVLDGDGGQPLVALWPVVSSRAAVGAALDAGDRAVHRVQHGLGFRTCDLAPVRLGNLNTPADFESTP